MASENRILRVKGLLLASLFFVSLVLQTNSQLDPTKFRPKNDEEVVELTAEQIEVESKSCTKEITMGRSKCIATTNCCYYEYWNEDMQASLPVCDKKSNLIQQLTILSTNTGKSSYKGYVKAHETLYGLPIHISPYFRRFDKPTQSNTASSSNLQNLSSIPTGELQQVYTYSETFEKISSDYPYNKALKHYRIKR